MFLDVFSSRCRFDDISCAKGEVSEIAVFGSRIMEGFNDIALVKKFLAVRVGEKFEQIKEYLAITCYEVLHGQQQMVKEELKWMIWKFF